MYRLKDSEDDPGGFDAGGDTEDVLKYCDPSKAGFGYGLLCYARLLREGKMDY